MNLHHICDNCSSEFTIKYDKDQVEDNPSFCPFCAEMIVDVEDLNEDDDE
jgi:hypothetical protein